MRCPNCEHETDLDVCESCGTEILSEADDKMDELVENASIPNLGAMLRRGKQKGFITPQEEGSGRAV